MGCFYDTNSFVGITGLTIASISFICSSMSIRTSLWIRSTLGLMIGLFLYVLLSNVAPSIWVMSPTLIIITISSFGIFCCFFFSIVGDMLLAFAWISLVTPFLLHNSQVVATWIRELIWIQCPEWMGIIVLVLILSALLFLIWYSQLLHTIGILMRILISALMITLYARMLWLESNGDLSLCCVLDDDESVSIRTYFQERCPLGADNIFFIGLFILLLLVGSFIAWYFRNPIGLCACIWPKRIDSDSTQTKRIRIQTHTDSKWKGQYQPVSTL